MAVKVANITSSNVFDYENEVIVELHGRTDDGELTVISYFFEPDADDPTRLTPREQIESVHEDAVQQALQASDYTIP